MVSSVPLFPLPLPPFAICCHHPINYIIHQPFVIFLLFLVLAKPLKKLRIDLHFHAPTHSCGVPLFANKPLANCKQCSTPTSLSINPRLIGSLIDETGTIAAGKLIWHPAAWAQLLGRKGEELASSSTTVLKYLEHRLLFLRVSVFFGWSEDVGRLCVFRVGIC